MATTIVPNSTRTSRPDSPWRPRIAALGYVAAWVVGLTAFGAGPAADATDLELARYVAEHRSESAAQSVLVHGVAALALLAVLATARIRPASRAARTAGLAAVGLSLVQCALGLWRSAVSTGTTTASLVHAIDRIDGVKMLALAVMTGTGTLALRANGRIARAGMVIGMLATVCLAVAGLAYLAAIHVLLIVAAPALVSLLAWVAIVGFTSGRATA